MGVGTQSTVRFDVLPRKPGWITDLEHCAPTSRVEKEVADGGGGEAGGWKPAAEARTGEGAVTAEQIVRESGDVLLPRLLDAQADLPLPT